MLINEKENKKLEKLKGFLIIFQNEGAVKLRIASRYLEKIYKIMHDFCCCIVMPQ